MEDNFDNDPQLLAPTVKSNHINQKMRNRTSEKKLQSKSSTQEKQKINSGKLIVHNNQRIIPPPLINSVNGESFVSPIASAAIIVRKDGSQLVDSQKEVEYNNQSFISDYDSSNGGYESSDSTPKKPKRELLIPD